MSEIYGQRPEPRVISVEQQANGLTRMVVRIPMVMRADGDSLLAAPQPQSYPAVPGFLPAGASGSEDEAGGWGWNITYEGGPVLGGGGSPEAEENTVYRFEPMDGDAGITTHPDFTKWIGRYCDYDEESKTITWYKKLKGAEAGDEERPNPFYGVEGYLVSDGIWTKQYTARRVPADIFAGIESIVESVPAPEWIRPPRIGAKKWLKLRPGFEGRGNVVVITERYRLGDFNRLIYSGRQAR